MTTFRMPRDHRPVIFDSSSFPIAGGRDEDERGRAVDDRALAGELAKMFPASINPRLAPNAGDRDLSAMKERLRDDRPGELMKMFPDSANPRLNFR